MKCFEFFYFRYSLVPEPAVVNIAEGNFQSTGTDITSDLTFTPGEAKQAGKDILSNEIPSRQSGPTTIIQNIRFLEYLCFIPPLLFLFF